MFCVRDAVTDTLATICGTAPSLVPDRSGPFSGIMAVISFTGSARWSLLLGLPRETAERIALAFARFEIPYDSVEMGDAVGELVNVIAGGAVRRLDVAGFEARMTLPTVTRGEGIEVVIPHDQRRYSLEFSSPEGPFWVRVITNDPH
jgi:chemotaxis protein CheX